MQKTQRQILSLELSEAVISALYSLANQQPNRTPAEKAGLIRHEPDFISTQLEEDYIPSVHKLQSKVKRTIFGPERCVDR